MYSTQEIRKQFLGLHQTDESGQLPLLFDGPGGSQLPKVVVDALADYLYCFNSNLGGQAHAGKITQEINEQARKVAAIWLGAQSNQIIFGLNSTSLMFNIARSLAKTWQAGDNIIVSNIDHFSHVSSWQLAAQDRGVEVRYLPLVDDGSELDLKQLDSLIDDKTRLVAVSLASNVLGSKTDIQTVINKAHVVSAKVSVDAVHAVVHEAVNVASMGCDLLFASAYKLGGAHLGICCMSHELLDNLQPYKVEPATCIPPNSWEQGTQSFEAQAALISLVHYWAGLSKYANPQMQIENLSDNLRLSIERAYDCVFEHEQQLTQLFLDEVAIRPYIKLYGKCSTQERTPTFAFNLLKDGQIIPNAPISHWLGTKNVALPSGNFYALGVVRHLGIENTGFLRAGFLHYTTCDEVKRLFELLDQYQENYLSC